MPKYHAPRRGSLGFVRKRASRIYPRVSSWPKISETKLLGFPAYKVGMLSIQEIYERPGSIFHGIKRVIAATALETPPVRVIGIRGYRLTPYGLVTVTEAWTTSLTDFEKKYLSRRVTLPKKNDEQVFNKRIELLSNLAENNKLDKVRAIIRTRPELTGIGKKKPELLEVEIGGEIIDAVKYAIDILGKEISINDVFSPGEYVDVIGVTKGYGFQGVVKRFGVKILPPKKKKTKRAVGSLGPWTPGRVMWTVPRYGQLGFFKRTEYNKQIMAIIDAEKADNFNPKGGWIRYGIIRNSAIILRGSVQGPPKRMLLLRHAIRPKRKPFKPTILGVYYSKEKINIPLE